MCFLTQPSTILDGQNMRQFRFPRCNISKLTTSCTVHYSCSHFAIFEGASTVVLIASKLALIWEYSSSTKYLKKFVSMPMQAVYISVCCINLTTPQLSWFSAFTPFIVVLCTSWFSWWYCGGRKLSRQQWGFTPGSVRNMAYFPQNLLTRMLQWWHYLPCWLVLSSLLITFAIETDALCHSYRLYLNGR